MGVLFCSIWVWKSFQFFNFNQNDTTTILESLILQLFGLLSVLRFLKKSLYNAPPNRAFLFCDKCVAWWFRVFVEFVKFWKWLKNGSIVCGFWNDERKSAYFQKKKKKTSVARKFSMCYEIYHFCSKKRETEGTIICGIWSAEEKYVFSKKKKNVRYRL